MERDIPAINITLVKSISTHTLTWSVTGWECAPATDKQNFNSHAHVERDITLDMLDTRKFNFNSHAHVERDQGLNAPAYLVLYFNSHAHVERDNQKADNKYKQNHFNSHAHVERDGTYSIDYIAIV